MSGPIKSSRWKSPRADRIGAARRPVLRLLPAALLLLGAGLLISIRSSASQVSAYVVCARQALEEHPLLYPPGTRLVRVAGGAVRPLEGFDLTSRPRLSYTADRVLFSARREGEEFSQIWEMGTDGGAPNRVIRVDADCVTPDLLPDGTVVFSRLEPHLDGGPRIGCLFVVDGDGNSTRISFGRDLDLVERILDDGRILVRRFSNLHRDGIQLALRPDGTELERYLARGPSPSVRRRPRRDGRVQPAAADSVGPITDASWLEPGYHIVGSVRVAPRVPPPVSTSVVNSQLDYGWLLCLDARLSDMGASLERAHRIRVVDTTSGRILGGGPLASDGSAYLKVPADRLLSLEVLDEAGNLLARQSDGIWVRPNEHRGCVGCHEPRYRSPENRSPLALEQAPVEIGGTEAASHSPVKGRP